MCHADVNWITLAMDGGSDRKAGPAATLSKGLRVLSKIADAKRPLPIRELLAETELPRATLHRMLQTLIGEGLVRYFPAEQTYGLGMRLFEMAHSVWEDLDVRATAAEEMRRLRDLTGESIRLGLLDGTDVVYVEEAEGLHDIRSAMRLGRRDPAEHSAIGRALAAFLPASVRAPLEERAARQGIAAPHLVFDLVRVRGYAVEARESGGDVGGLAAPIIDHRGRATFSIGLVGPSFRLSEKVLHELGPLVLESAERIARRTGGQPRALNTDPGPPTAPSRDIHCAVEARHLLGEAPTWCASRGRIYWLDIAGPSLCWREPDGLLVDCALDECAGGMAMCADGTLLVASQSGFLRFNPDSRKVVEVVARADHDDRELRFNGGRCDSHGRFWSGIVHIDDLRDRARLYCLDPTRGLLSRLEGISHANGIGWSPENCTFYFTDTHAKTVYAFDFQPDTGEISSRRDVFKMALSGNEFPAGCAVDAEGCIWVAIWNGWRVERRTPDGTLLQTLHLPVPRPSSCVFGGEDMQELFITTARIRLSQRTLQAAPLSGSVLGYRAKVPGLPIAAFRG